MKIIISFLAVAMFSVQCSHTHKAIATAENKTIENTGDSAFYILGNFTDDYGIHYSISDTLWEQLPIIKYHILRWNKKEQYIIAKNDAMNPSEGGLYTRIDYMQFYTMKPWLWGFCYTAYKATSDAAAVATQPADRNNPMKGCNGFPFSRMMQTR